MTKNLAVEEMSPNNCVQRSAASGFHKVPSVLRAAPADAQR